MSLNELIDEIEASSSEQAHGITSISGAMEQMEKVTQANAANAEGSATAAAGLTAQAQILKRTSDDLYAMISGKKTVVNSVGKMPKSINETAEKADIINRKFCAVASEDVIPFEKDNGGF